MKQMFLPFEEVLLKTGDRVKLIINNNILPSYYKKGATGTITDVNYYIGVSRPHVHVIFDEHQEDKDWPIMNTFILKKVKSTPDWEI
jgi:hypothetical protein